MKSNKKHTKKAVTLLNKIETLLDDVLTECAALEKTVEKNVKELLRAAEGPIKAAKEFIALGAWYGAEHKPAVRKHARPHPAAKRRTHAASVAKRRTIVRAA